MANSVAVGAAIAVGGYELGLLETVLKEYFAHLGKDIIEANVKAARAGYEHAHQQALDENGKITGRVPLKPWII
jgi:2-oxoglutarate ferredoxin oxidoreductase subunit alpha